MPATAEPEPKPATLPRERCACCHLPGTLTHGLCPVCLAELLSPTAGPGDTLSVALGAAARA